MAKPLLRIHPGFQHYAWGDTQFIPAFFGIAPDARPHAEAWFGTHPALPSIAETDGQRVPLDALLRSEGAAVLGPSIQARCGDLPFLAKILSAARPLSVQVHPTRAQAIAGFRREQAAGIPADAPGRSYRDANPKPEILVALTPFAALVGFRPPAEIAQALAAAPEIAGLLPAWPASGENPAAALKALVTAYFRLPEAQLFPVLRAWVDRLQTTHPAPASAAGWILECDRLFSAPARPDRGLFMVALLNLVTLAPGEAVFLPAGVPHAYLRGSGVEVMANSDNVLRAGLTPKPLDVQQLLEVVDFRGGAPAVLRPLDDLYSTTAEEFEVRRHAMGDGRPEIALTARGPVLLLFAADTPESRLAVECDGDRRVLGQGAALLVAHGTPLRLRASGAGTVFAIGVPDLDAPPLFRGREPARLAFGTSGLRGLVTDITDLEAWINTRGFLDYLVETGDLVAGMPIVVGGDLRPSTDSPARSILRAVAQAVGDAGFAAIHAGLIPTPALAAYAFARGWPSVMVTGSHIPFDRNGIKFNRPRGEVLKADEAGIVAAVERVRRAAYAGERVSAPSTRFDDQGMFRAPPPALPPVDPAARACYVRRYLDFFPPGALGGMRIVVFEHTAVGREVLAEVLRGLGAEVHALGRTGTFVAIDTEAIPDERLEQMQALADDARLRFGAFDALVSTDGDSDRPMVFGLTAAGRLRFFGGDALGIVVADYLDADALAVPITATDAIERHFAGRSVQIVRTRVGSPFVIDAIAAVAGERKVGWEANGGFLSFSTIVREGRSLPPLPTRDALLPICTVLHSARLRGATVAGLLDTLPARFARAGLLDQVAVARCRSLAERYGSGEPGLRSVRYTAQGVWWTDHEGREQPAGGPLAERLRALYAMLAEDFHAGRGFAPLAAIDYLDGLRLIFADGDVAHVRASGNAPQLRIYALASTDARARAIVDLALAPETGLLAAMLGRGAGSQPPRMNGLER